MPLTIDLAIDDDSWVTDVAAPAALQALAERAVAAALRQVDRAEVTVPNGADVSLVLCDDAFIQGLNRQWRGIDAPTNVLSFPSAAPVRATTLGDIVVAYETVAREAAERGTTRADHLTHLVVHGLLHLLGLDHEAEEEAERMEALEVRALAALGIASPYDEAQPMAAVEVAR